MPCLPFLELILKEVIWWKKAKKIKLSLLLSCSTHISKLDPQEYANEEKIEKRLTDVTQVWKRDKRSKRRKRKAKKVERNIWQDKAVKS